MASELSQFLDISHGIKSLGGAAVHKISLSSFANVVEYTSKMLKQFCY